jgi:hypothetical protein
VLGKKAAIVGSASVAIGGFTWAAASFAGGWLGETFWCASFGAGFLIVLLALLLPLHPLSIPAGFVVSAAPAFYWSQSAAAAGAIGSPWLWFGLGICVAALAALGSLWRPQRRLAGWIMRGGLGVAAASTFIMVIQLLSSPTPWILAEILVAVGLGTFLFTGVSHVHQPPTKA